MDFYFQGVVAEYLRANRCTFINSEFLLQLDEGANPAKGRSWNIDLLAVNFEQAAVFLCEVRYAKSPSSLVTKLIVWASHWNELLLALQRDARIPQSWNAQPWIFVPEATMNWLVGKIPPFPCAARLTTLEQILPWKYCNWDRAQDHLVAV